MSQATALAIGLDGWRGLEIWFDAEAVDALEGEPDAVSAIRYALERLGGNAPVMVLRALLMRDYCYRLDEVDDAILDARMACPAAFTFHRMPK